MHESLILLIAVAVLAVPAVAAAALVVAMKTGRRYDELDRRLNALARELHGLRRGLHGDATESPGEPDTPSVRGGHTEAPAESPGDGGARRGYSFSFLEEKAQWEKEPESPAGVPDKKPGPAVPAGAKSGRSGGRKQARNKRRKKKS